MNSSKPTLLCVEDIPEIQAALRRMLKDEFEIETASTAAEAVGILSNGHGIDIVLSDWQLTDATAEGVVSLTEGLHLPLVFHSSSSPEKMPVGHIILQKPCSKDKIIDALLYELDKSRNLVVSDQPGCPNCDGAMESTQWPPDMQYVCSGCGYKETR